MNNWKKYISVFTHLSFQLDRYWNCNFSLTPLVRQLVRWLDFHNLLKGGKLHFNAPTGALKVLNLIVHMFEGNSGFQDFFFPTGQPIAVDCTYVLAHCRKQIFYGSHCTATQLTQSYPEKI